MPTYGSTTVTIGGTGGTDYPTNTLSGSISTLDIDGVTSFSENDRILVNSRTNSWENGFYFVSSIDSSNYTLQRTYDADNAPSGGEVVKGALTYIEEGDDYSQHQFILSGAGDLPTWDSTNGFSTTEGTIKFIAFSNNSNTIQDTDSIVRDGNKLNFTNVLESGTNLNIQNNAIQNGSDTVLMTNAGVIKNADQDLIETLDGLTSYGSSGNNTTCAGNGVIDGNLTVSGSGGITVSSGNITLGSENYVKGQTGNENNVAKIFGSQLKTTSTITSLGDIRVYDSSDNKNFEVVATSGNTTVGGTLDVTDNLSADGGISVATSKFTVATSGNTSIAGTLGVSGATTLSGALNANGGIACDTDKFTVADGTGNTSIAGTLDVSNNLSADGGISVATSKFTVATSGNTSIAGTLGVSGATTLSGALDATSIDASATLDVSGTTTLSGILNANNGIKCNTDKFVVDKNTGNTSIAGTLDVTGSLTGSSGSFSSSITGGSLTDGTATLSSGALSGATTVTATGAVTGGSLTDGTATLSSGALGGATTVTATGAVTGGSLTDGTATLSSGALSGATTVTASGAITGGSLTDGTATLDGGSLTDAVTITASGTVTGASLTDGSAILNGGSLTNATNVTASGAVTGGSLTRWNCHSK